jgi:hypothetical protein
MSVRGICQFMRSGNWLAGCLVGYLTLILCDSGQGQEIPTSRSSERRLAPDAFIQIPPAAQYGETYQGPIDLPLVVNNPELAWEPHYSPKSATLAEMAKDVVFRGDVYCLDFAFKSVRMIEVQGQNVWYMLYRVRYLGGDLRPVVEPDPFDNQVFATPATLSAGTLETLPGRFMPLFRLHVRGLRKEYLDQIIPGAKAAIAAKERVGRPIYDSVEMQTMAIKLWRDTDTADNSLWGVAMWTGVDPRTDHFSVHVEGLTNAQRLKLEGDQIKYLQKNLVLNFSRPGDTINELEDRIRYGVPALADPERQRYVLQQYGLEDRLDHLWIYR